MPTAPNAALCQHCFQPIPPGAGTEPYCCRGCAAVHALLVDQGLTRYYELAGDRPAPAPPEPGPRSLAWLEPLLEAEAAAGGGELGTLRLDVQGIHCAACVWLIQETFRRRAGAASALVNPALGKVTLTFRRGGFDVRAWLAEVEAFGYRFGPPRKATSRASVDLPIRLGIAAALTVNVMLFSVSFYFGLAPGEGDLFRLFSGLSLALSTIAVGVGGWPFFRSALQGLRRGVFHLDLPIAVGILLVYATSLARMREGRGDLAYFDTLNVFITLMLAGRFVQERALERNRRFLLEDDGAEGLFVRRLEEERLVTEPVARVKTGDRLLVAPGDLVPVDARLIDVAAEVSTDWIHGESEPRAVAAGETVAAGSFNAGRAAFHVEATCGFADSPLVALLRQPPPRAARSAPFRRFWDRLARGWVAAVVTLALAGFVLWLPAGFDRALDVAAALLVVTCPCAIGIAVPLAYELTLHRLRRAGFFVRGEDLLDRLTRVRKILFDKTGTLTLGRLELARPEGLAALPAGARDAAYNLAARSLHPVAQATARALAGAGARYDARAAVTETPGQGLEWRRADGLWRLGRGDWAVAGANSAEAVLSRDGRPLAPLATREVLRPDARHELAALAGAGYEIWLVSGDRPAKVAALAAALDIAPGRALSGQTPAQKAAAVARVDAGDTLFLGDGVNDALAFEAALAAGTPAIDRPVMPGKSDFFLVGEGLAPLALALAEARRLRRVVRGLLAGALVYNAAVVAAALCGLVSPVVAAVAMPVSTLALVARTVLALGPGRRGHREAAPLALAEARP